jgi:hypothetical protein
MPLLIELQATSLRDLINVAEEADLSETEKFLKGRWGSRESDV